MRDGTPRLKAFLFLGFLTVASLSGETQTLNREKLEGFREAFAKRQGPVRVLSFGDSMADSYRSIGFYLVSRMLEKRPLAGTSFNNSFGASLFTSTNGASVAPPSHLWFSHQFKVPSGSSAQWNSAQHQNGFLANELAVYWIAQPEGGQVNLLVSERGGPWEKLSELDGFSSSPKGCVSRFSLPLAEYRVRADALSGTNYLLGPELVNTSTNGLHVAWLDYGGITVQQVVDVPRAIREPILRAFAPDLLIWHFKEGVDALESLPAALVENEGWFAKTVSNMDVLYIGTPFAQDPVNGAHTVSENRLIRDFAGAHGRAFVDCMSPGISYDWLESHGFMTDPIHPNSAGGEFLARAAWLDLGFYALGANRDLGMTRGTRTLNLQATLSPGLIYDFQASENLADWTTFHSRTNESGPIQIPISVAAGAKNFRLVLKPPN